MCLVKTLSRMEQRKTLKKYTDPMVCWKVVRAGGDGLLRPLHQCIPMSYHTGVNKIPRHLQYTDNNGEKRSRLGAHFFKHRAAAIAVAAYQWDNRGIIRCLVAKKDIDTVGYSPMSCYNHPDALTIVANKATFAKTIRRMSKYG